MKCIQEKPKKLFSVFLMTALSVIVSGSFQGERIMAIYLHTIEPLVLLHGLVQELGYERILIP